MQGAEACRQLAAAHLDASQSLGDGHQGGRCGLAALAVEAQALQLGVHLAGRVQGARGDQLACPLVEELVAQAGILQEEGLFVCCVRRA